MRTARRHADGFFHEAVNPLQQDRFKNLRQPTSVYFIIIGFLRLSQFLKSECPNREFIFEPSLADIRCRDLVPKTTLQRVAAGEHLAVEECLKKYGGLVWSIARKLLPNHADAEDAVQEVFIEIWRHAHRFDPRVASETTYITMIARRRFIDHLRRRSRQPAMDPIQEEMPDSIFRQERKTEIEEEALRARRYMRQLRPEQQKVLELSITHGLSQSQIAETTNLSLGTVKTHTRRGLIRLRELLGVDEVGNSKGGSS